MRFSPAIKFTSFIALLLFTVSANAQSSKKVANQYLKSLLTFEKWAESVWHDDPDIPGAGYWGDGISGGNAGIRGTSGVAVAYAVLIREYPNAPEKARRLKHLQASVKFAIATHESGSAGMLATDGKKWGAYPGVSKTDVRIWQSSMWAATMGFAAALVEKQLDPETIIGVKRVIAAEADLLVTIPPPSGFHLDSKGEENAWNTSIPAMAAAWMPKDKRAADWLRTTKSYLANSYSVPKDSTGALKQWISTQTLFPSYAMENHNFYHPSYQAVAGMSMGDTYLMTKFIAPQLAQQLLPFTEHNVLPVWNFISGIVMDSGEIAYPSGLDWSLHSFEHVSYLAYLSTHFKNPQAQWAENHLAKQILLRQNINSDGTFVGESCPDNFYREAVEAYRIAMAYLHHQLAGFPTVAEAPLKNHITNYPDVGLLVQRNDNALITISYGSKVTALVYPQKGKAAGQDFIISPNTNSLLGQKGKVVMSNYRQTAAGFYVELSFTNKDAHSKIIVESNAESVAFLEITDTNLKQNTDWYLMAIENHPLTGIGRTAYWQTGSAMFKERSGTKSPDINSSWINVDNWMGIVAKPDGAFIYNNAAKYNRNGAAEDVLSYRSGNVAARAVIILPGKNAAVTASVSKSAVLTSSGNEIKLQYTTPNGKLQTINYLN
jgi:hypothetical protein